MLKILQSKLPAVVLGAAALAVLFTGCAKNGPSNANTSPGAPQIESYDYTGYKDYTEDGLGITLKLPGKYLDNESIVPGKYEVMFGDLSLLDAPKAETDPSNHLDMFFMPQKGEYILFRVLAYPADKWDGWTKFGKKATDITKGSVSEELCRKDGIVYVYDQPPVDTSAFDSDMKSVYNDIIGMLPAIKASIKNTTPNVGDLGAFTASDLSGGAVDNAIFKDHKLTMINIWATFCKPCIREMPDLQKMSEEMPEGTQLISIVGDVTGDETLKLAQEIAKDAGMTFTSIVPDDALKKYLDANIVAYPTTLFVDSAGKIVGEPIIGERDLSVYKETLNDRLALTGA